MEVMKLSVTKRLIKYITGVLCCLCLLSGNFFTVCESVYADEETPTDAYIPGNIALEGDINTPTGYIGQNMNLKLHLVNRGTESASNIVVTPKVSSDIKVFPFEIAKANYSLTLRGSATSPNLERSILEGGEDDEVTFTFTVRENAITGYYPIDFEVSYVTESAGLRTTTVTFYVYIIGEEEETTSGKTDLQLSLRNSPQLPAATYGQPLEFELHLTNFGKSDAYSVVITPQTSEDASKFPFEIESTTYEKRVDGIILGTSSQKEEAGRTTKIKYSMVVRNKVKSGYYPVVFHITAKDINGEEYAVEQTVYFNVNGNPKEDEEAETTTEGKLSVPRLVVTGYELDKEEISAGDTFKLTIHIMNTSTRTAVSNLKFTLSSSEDKNDNCFIPLSGSSTVFIQRIGIGETVDLEIDMTAKPTLEAKSYPITIASEYEDSDVNPYTGTESISIPVTQELRVSVGDIEVMPASIEVGSQSNVMLSFNNLGKSKIYNVSLSVQGDSITGGDAFKGNLDSGETANFDVMVTGSAATMDDGTVKAIISYENEKGDIFTAEKEFSLFVSEPYIPGPDEMGEFGNIDIGGMEVMGEPQKTVNWTAIGIAGAVVIAAVAAAVVIILKRKKRKKEEGMDDDEIL